ncbi:methylated-DNA--[protein]-cysteine S-methyltransferase [Deltaproteobacteria bacterium TL4]
MFYSYLDSPVGSLLVVGSELELKSIQFPKGTLKKEPQASWDENRNKLASVLRQLEAYFQGKLTTFDIPFRTQGTSFQQQVWKALQTIPYGQTASYREIAVKINFPKAYRAVGRATASNPLPLIVPCHRVIGSNGALTGFSGGLEIKEKLLQLEQHFRAVQVV